MTWPMTPANDLTAHLPTRASASPATGRDQNIWNRANSPK